MQFSQQFREVAPLQKNPAHLAAMVAGMTDMEADMEVSAEEDSAASADAVFRTAPSCIRLFFHFLFTTKVLS